MNQRRIQILPTLLSNQIAAGEVVERPASIVKELIENSLDAGAKNIEIRVEEGGLQAITIIDDGQGIPREDLILAITPHATSKIYSLEELEDLQSLGFRGEALASIASVSRFMLKSRHHSAEDAWQIEIEGKEDRPEIKPASLTEGTKIEVRDLFFNTPARREFLKSQATEFSHIEEVVRKLALSHAEVSFSLTHNHKKVLQVEAGDPAKRLAILCGKSFSEETQFIQVAKTGLSLEGWLVHPKYLKRSASQQYFYVNGRPIRDKLLIHAIKEGYRDVLYGEHQPDYVLFLEIDPKSVDFNVHPAKLEVRFREGRLLHDFVRSEVKKVWAVESQSSPLTKGTEKQNFTYPSWQEGTVTSVARGIRPQQTLDLLFETQASPHQSIEQLKSRFGQAICQLKGLFILTESDEGLVIIDMHAAHERILYERLKANWQQQHWERQVLLLPQGVELSRQEEVIFKEHQDKFIAMGFVIDEWMDHKVMIREVPLSLAKSNLEKFLRELLHDLEVLGHSNQTEVYLDQILAEVACHSAIQAHHPLSLPEMNQLLKDMEVTPNIDYCNHGRPTWRLFKVEEINRLFLRGR